MKDKLSKSEFSKKPLLSDRMWDVVKPWLAVPALLITAIIGYWVQHKYFSDQNAEHSQSIHNVSSGQTVAQLKDPTGPTMGTLKYNNSVESAGRNSNPKNGVDHSSRGSAPGVSAEPVIEKTPDNSANNQNLASYINSQGKVSDVAIMIVDDNKSINNALSSSIASLYKLKNLTTTTSLLNQGFVTSIFYQKLLNGEFGTIDNLAQATKVKYIVIGKYSNQFEAGEYTKYISRARLNISIVSCGDKSILDAFELHAANGYNDKDHAEQGVIEKLLSEFEEKHLSL